MTLQSSVHLYKSEIIIEKQQVYLLTPLNTRIFNTYFVRLTLINQLINHSFKFNWCIILDKAKYCNNKVLKTAKDYLSINFPQFVIE